MADEHDGSVRRWSRLDLALLAAAVVVFAAVALLGVLALTGDDRTCTTGTRELDAPVDRPAEEALGQFVAQNAEVYPLEGWEVVDATDDRTMFTNDDGGDFEIVVEQGVVTSFERCE